MMNLRTIRTLLLGFLLVTLVTLLGLYHVYRQSRQVELGTKLGQLSEQLEILKRENAVLEGEYLTLRSDPALLQMAEQQLYLRPPTEGEIFTLKEVQGARPVTAVDGGGNP